MFGCLPSVYSTKICIKHGTKSQPIGWKDLRQAAVSCSSHLLLETQKLWLYEMTFLLQQSDVLVYYLTCFLLNFCLFLPFLSAILKPFPFFLISSSTSALLCLNFQGISGEPGKRGKMGRPVKFCLNILYRKSFQSVINYAECVVLLWMLQMFFKWYNWSLGGKRRWS